MAEYELTGTKSPLMLAIERAVGSIPVSGSVCAVSAGEMSERTMTEGEISVQLLDSLCLIGRYEKPSNMLSVY